MFFLGDGRMDSPGHSAQYCSYTFMEFTTTTKFLHNNDGQKTDNWKKHYFREGLLC
jgi:uncharacterized protein YfdQ (DUF2303 family)